VPSVLDSSSCNFRQDILRVVRTLWVPRAK
jgi:hypothetical protein